MKIRVAVFLGGRSPEHDVSIMTGLQALDALDQRLYEGFPVYIALDGRWWVGDALRDKRNYIPSAATKAQLQCVTLRPRPGELGGALVGEPRRRLFGAAAEEIPFDVALLALHGASGEDGRLQGALELAEVPYTGMRLMASALLMDKAATKRAVAQIGIPVVPFAVIDRPAETLMPSEDAVRAAIAGLEFPLIVKPNHLGSSIGVAKATGMDELRAALPAIFNLDSQAIVERCVENLVEYNLAVTRIGGRIATSALERPKTSAELLDFKEKYLAGAGAKKTGQRAQSQGMLSLTRDINPDLPPGAEADLRDWATRCFALVDGTGNPRIDFLSDAKSGEFWLNEVNPCPGSFAYFLWEAAGQPLLFAELLDKLVQEAIILQREAALPADPTLPEARLFERH